MDAMPVHVPGQGRINININVGVGVGVEIEESQNLRHVNFFLSNSAVHFPV